MKTHRSFGLDVLRTAAIFLVLAHHAGGTLATHSAFFHPLHYAGLFGVELFFVLSGFLVGGIFLRPFLAGEPLTRHALMTFYVRRWVRTLPNYYLFLILCAGIALYHAYPVQRPLSYLVFAQNLTQEIPGFFSASWSLAVEEWFYLLLPISGYFAARLLPRRAAILSVIAFFLFVPTALRALFAPEGNWENMRRIVIFRIDSLMYGVLAAYLAHAFARRWGRGIPLVAVGVVLELLALNWVTRLETSPTLVWDRVALYPTISLGFALMLPAFQFLTSPSARITRAMTFFSVCSYSAYLVHLELQIPFNSVWNTWLPDGLGALKALTWMTVVWTLSYLLYRFFEKPLMDLRPDQKSRNTTAEDPTPRASETSQLQSQ